MSDDHCLNHIRTDLVDAKLRALDSTVRGLPDSVLGRVAAEVAAPTGDRPMLTTTANALAFEQGEVIRAVMEECTARFAVESGHLVRYKEGT